ncbi:HAM1 domain-containing protein [Encephalitozoon hellem ATCC 50504]|uniref:Ham1 nucleotide triphosphosphatase n=1 Tax=Encephalitozoon hellem TaxID=27973 RepID=A0A9Q9C304_ENCHE|nr:HAM1 domain-containing protein [Encephalitozoon hellem ATCC 50504]AFM98305.1 HAM1 domain-containing protein [Encephalitozoon hellem ATCC 50504]UTX43184.1 Ham1 nucleotide triphosphosphatase [Encephalitozoon hellem]|eukprot:XP_003887286.1 HAM1 domain-containing protein [Encephalitozoon hellem ATCC 50504]
MEGHETVLKACSDMAICSRETIDRGHRFGESAPRHLRAIFITSSSYKYETFRKFLNAPVELVVLDIEEIQGSKEEIMMDKLRKASHLVTESTIAFVDDTSIHMNGLEGFPGQYAKDFLKIGAPRILEIASKVGRGCSYSTIIGMMRMEEGKVVTKTFCGEVRGDIVRKGKEDPRVFNDIFVPREEEYDEVPCGMEGVKIGRYRAVEKVKRHLREIGIYERLFEN